MAAAVRNFRRGIGIRGGARDRAASPDRDSRRRIDWSNSAILGHRSVAARDLADLAAARMVGSALPWTQRQFLLRQARGETSGDLRRISSLRAVQNHLAVNPPAPLKSAPARRTRIPLGLLTFCVVQTAIVTIAWRLLFS
jgi:hypothetical protein